MCNTGSDASRRYDFNTACVELSCSSFIAARETRVSSSALQGCVKSIS